MRNSWPSRPVSLRTSGYPQTSGAVPYVHSFAGGAEFTVVHNLGRFREMLEASVAPGGHRLGAVEAVEV